MSVALGFDYGQARIGLAIGNRQTGLSRALSSLPRPRSEADWSPIARQVEQWEPSDLIVGEPLTLDGKSQPLTRAARRFAAELAQRFSLPVHQVDERLSSASAGTELREARQRGEKSRRNRRGDDDSLAAAILVQQWLDSA